MFILMFEPDTSVCLCETRKLLNVEMYIYIAADGSVRQSPMFIEMSF